MVRTMDRRALLGLLPAAAGLVLGGAAVAVGSALLGVVAAVYTPKDFQLGRMMEEIAALAERHRAG